jgi:hypothetical protein
MIQTKNNHIELAEIMERLPEEKVVEVVDFAKFLLARYWQGANSQIDESSLLLQQKAVARIWDDPEEDVYEL